MPPIITSRILIMSTRLKTKIKIQCFSIDRMKLLFAAILLFGFVPEIRSQNISFFREKIKIIVQDSVCTVEGTYYFKNDSGEKIRKPLLYPFFVNDSMPCPEQAEVINFFDNKQIPFIKAKNAVSFHITLAPKSIAAYKVIYKQKTPFKMMRYILTTTKRWGRPFQIAEYEIQIPKKLKLIRSTINNLSKTVSGRWKKYYIRLEDFMPQKDLVIRWRRQNR